MFLLVGFKIASLILLSCLTVTKMPQLFSTKLSLERSDAIFGTENSSQFLSQTMNARFEFRPGQGLLQTQNSAPKQLTFTKRAAGLKLVKSFSLSTKACPSRIKIGQVWLSMIESWPCSHDRVHTFHPPPGLQSFVPIWRQSPTAS